MKILIINNRYRFEGGEEAVVNSEIEMLKKIGHDVILYERSNREFDDFSLLRKLRFLIKDIIWSKETYNEIKKIVKKNKPYIAHIHNIFFMISPSVYYALKEENIPVVQALHNYRLFCPNKGKFYRNGEICEECSKGNFIPVIIHRCGGDSFILTLFLTRMLKYHSKKKTFQNKITTYIASSEFSKNKLIELGLSKDKIFVKPNFIDLKIDEAENRKDYALFIGRLFDYKGIDTLISAYEKLSKSRLKIIGDGPLFHKLNKRTSKLKNIEILGRLPNDKKFEYLKNASFLIFPSTCYENMPRTIIEAFACGVPVIASRLGMLEELVEDGRTGLHFTPGDSRELASKIEWAWGHPNRLKQMSKEARFEYESKYSTGRNYELLIEIYNRSIEENKQ